MVDHLEIHSLLGYNIPTFYGTHSFNQHVTFLKFLFPFFFPIPLPLKTFYTAPRTPSRQLINHSRPTNQPPLQHHIEDIYFQQPTITTYPKIDLF